MDKNEWKEILVLDHMINSKCRLLSQLKQKQSFVKSLQSNTDRVQSSPKNCQEEVIVRILDLELDITRDIDCLIDKKWKAKKEIDRLSGIHKVVMSMRYLECMRWEKIAHQLHYSIQAVYKIHGQALIRLKND